MALTLSELFSKLQLEERELNRAIAKIALLKGINTAERKKFAVKANACKKEITQTWSQV